MLEDKTTFSEKIAEPGRSVLSGGVIDDRFKILRMLGQGGMCEVYEAEHLLLSRHVAIKLLHLSSVSSPEAIARFQREAILASELRHPNIIELHGFGVWNSRPYIAMEYLEGRTLSELLELEGPLPEDRALHVLFQICSALTEAHERRIVHRDLKPSNIMVLSERETKRDTIKLVDFGIARLLPESGEEMQKLTQTGQVLGSFLYMSPEQCMGRRIDHRSDIYSFGCLMHKILSGKTPFNSEVPFELMGMHLGAPPPAVPGVSERLSLIAQWCLQKDPDDRPQSVQEVRAALAGGALPPSASRAATSVNPEPASKQKAFAVGRLGKIVLVSIFSLALASAGTYFLIIHPRVQRPSVVSPTRDPEEMRLVALAQRARTPQAKAASKAALCEYYFRRKQFDQAIVAGRAAVAAFDRAGERLTDAHYDTVFTLASALQADGKFDDAAGEFDKLAVDIAEVPVNLKLKACGRAAECLMAGLRRYLKANKMFARAMRIGDSSPDVDQNEFDQIKIEYAKFLLSHQYTLLSYDVADRYATARELLSEVLRSKASGETAEEHKRLAKGIIEFVDKIKAKDLPSRETPGTP